MQVEATGGGATCMEQASKESKEDVAMGINGTTRTTCTRAFLSANTTRTTGVEAQQSIYSDAYRARENQV